MSWSRPAVDSSSRAMASASRRTASRSAVTSPTILMARPGPGNGWRGEMARGRPGPSPPPPHLLLEQRAQRLHQSELQVIGEPAHVVVGLDVRGAGAAAGLDHVRVQGALDEEFARLAVLAGLGGDLPGGALEGADELPADDFPLLLRVGHPGQRG